MDLVHETWLRNLSNWFTNLPDGPVLWSEQILRSHRTTGNAVELEVVQHLSRLTERGLPTLSEVLPLAQRQLALITVDTPGLTMLRARLQEAMKYYRPGGTFAVFSAPAGTLSPALIR